MADTVLRTPWYHWAIAILALAWNSFGALDYTMTQLQGAQWLQQMGMTEAQIAYLEAMPSWTMAVWATGVWGGVLGAILLLARNRLAVPVFIISLAAFVLSLVYSYLLSNGAEVMGGPTTTIMNGIIFAACLFFVWYARWATGRGILR